MPHARGALSKLGRVEHSSVARRHGLSLTPPIDAKPQALLKAWRCLSAALFAGALATPAMAAMDMSEFGEEGMPLQLHHTMGGGGSTSQYYLGLGAGVSRVDPETISAGFSVDEPDSEGVKVFFGKYFLPKWRWEVGYTDAGAVGLSGPSGAAADGAEIDYKIPSIAIDYLLREPSAKLNFYLRGGAAMLKQASDDTRIEFEDENEAVGMLGLGMQWRMGRRLEARLGFESYGKDVAVGSLSLAAKLGGQHSARLPETSTAESVEMTPEPVVLPQVMTAPANNSVETPSSSDARLCKSVDRELSGVNFDSGSSVLSAGAKRQLDKVASALKQGPNIRVTVRGFTDSRGNSTKNQLLSQQRAQAVASYLMMAVGNFNNAPRAVGMGESNPIASNDTASGRAKNRRIELNLRAGKGCDDVAKSMEMDDKSRVFAGKVVETAALSRAETALIVPEATVQATFSTEHSNCRVTNRIIEGLHFGVGEFTLDNSGKRALMPILAALRNDSSLQVQINGHTDSVGKREANQLLSAMRARSVAAYLMSQAPNLSTVPHIVGAGELTPIASNASESGRARNRRIEISLAGGRSCHLPVQQAQSTFEPPVRASKRVQRADNVEKMPIESVPDNTVASAEIAQAAADKAAQFAADQAAAIEVAAKLHSARELKQQVLSELQQSAGLDAQEQGVEKLDQIPVPAAEALQEQPISALPLRVVAPIAEPALSDTIDVDGESSPVASSQACDGIDRIASGIQFAPGETRMDKQARKVLDPVIQLLRRDPGIEVIVEAHTDDVGSARDNMALSESRAKTVAAYLAGGAGMKKNLPLALGFGETKPVHSNTTASGRSANRRIVLKLHGGRGCLSNDMLAGIAGLEEIKAPAPTNALAQALAKHEADSKPAAEIVTKPAVAALADNRASMSESFSEVMARISRGHGACGKQAHVVEAIEFNSGDHRLDIEDQRALMPLVTLWREQPQLDIQVLGYTDNSGSKSGNQRLSQRRADAVAQFLMFEAGLAENAPKAKGMGESHPRASNDTPAGRQLNRRIEVLISGGDKCDSHLAAVAAPTVQQALVVQQAPAAAEGKPEVIELVQISAKDLAVPAEEATHSVSGGGSAAIAETLLACEDGELLHTDVKFDTGAFFLNDGSRAALSNVVELMRADPELQVEVQGHTDNVGTAKRNLSLSERRAEAVAQYLTHATGNIDNAPIAVGYGADMPLADNSDATGRAQNRRIDVLFSGGQSCGQSLAQADIDILEAETTNEWALPSQQLAQLGTQTSAVGEQCVAVQSVVENLNFEPAGYRLGARAKNALSDVIEVLRDDPSLMVEVYGYSADYGDTEFDHALAERRAETVADYLMVKSGNFENIPVAVGFGDLGQGVVANPDEGLYRANRIELRLSKGVACEQPLTHEISIRRPQQRAEADAAPSAAALLLSQGGGGSAVAVEPLVQSCQSEVRVLEGVSFSAGHFELDGSSKRALTQVAEALGAYPELQYAVHGHTDASGNPRANHALSEWRARVVAEYLARETGSWPVVADAEGFGETRPLASNDSAAGRAVNRRIELAIADSSC